MSEAHRIAHNQLVDHLRALPKHYAQRQAVELRFLQGLSVAETAAAMGRSEEAVKKLQARALVNLRRALDPAMRPATVPRRMLIAA